LPVPTRVEMLKPKPLLTGATIGIIAPSGPVDDDSVRKAAQFLKGRGYRIRLGQHLFRRRGYLAGTDDQRASDINTMFADPKIDGIFIARGGYGSARLLQLIDYNVVKKNPKILVGYSDATALQLALFTRCSLVSFYGPVVSIDFAGRTARESFARMLHAFDARAGAPLIPGRWPKSIRTLSPGRAEGRLIGGCLSVVASLIGSDYFPDVTGAILFLEDVGEAPYRIDRYLTQLELAGVLKSVAGVLLGRFIRCCAPGRKPSLTLDQVLTEKFARRPYPVLSGLPFGHIARKATLPQGVGCLVDTGRQTLEFRESPCLIPGNIDCSGA